MTLSLLRRSLHAIVLLAIISIIAFGLSKLAPGDEVMDYLSIDDSRYSSSSDPLEQRKSYARVSAKRGLDRPLFYFSIHPGYYPDSMYQILPMDDRVTVQYWIRTSKNKKEAIQFYEELISGLTYACPRGDTNILSSQFCQKINVILSTHELTSVQRHVVQLDTLIAQNGTSDAELITISNNLNSAIDRLVNSTQKISVIEWFPSMRWHGTKNQYHQWMSGLVTFKPLTSLVDGRNAWSKISVALKWTLLLNGLAFILAAALGIGIGIWSGTHDGHWLERLIHLKLFVLFALPSFWLATLFIFLFSSGEWLNIFPAGGLGPYHSAGSLLKKTGILTMHLILPVLCLAVGSLAYVSRQMKQSILQQMGQPYVLSLRTSGIPEKNILRKHVIRNALFPLITLIGGSLPVLISGSLIIEVIFSIPGMGRLMFTSLLSHDWPVVFPILMMSAGITIITLMITDIVYKWVDPRVKTIEP